MSLANITENVKTLFYILVFKMKYEYFSKNFLNIKMENIMNIFKIKCKNYFFFKIFITFHIENFNTESLSYNFDPYFLMINQQNFIIKKEKVKLCDELKLLFLSKTNFQVILDKLYLKNVSQYCLNSIFMMRIILTHISNKLKIKLIKNYIKVLKIRNKQNYHKNSDYFTLFFSNLSRSFLHNTFKINIRNFFDFIYASNNFHTNKLLSYFNLELDFNFLYVLKKINKLNREKILFFMILLYLNLFSPPFSTRIILLKFLNKFIKNNFLKIAIILIRHYIFYSKQTNINQNIISKIFFYQVIFSIISFNMSLEKYIKLSDFVVNFIKKEVYSEIELHFSKINNRLLYNTINNNLMLYHHIYLKNLFVLELSKFKKKEITFNGMWVMKKIFSKVHQKNSPIYIFNNLEKKYLLLKNLLLILTPLDTKWLNSI
ncbi:hypothetical protein [Guillardia theta]|uniref:Uncharacterized protein n=1 Tax=Guillardia theta TaxID=55529 RepID=Q9AW73_GUITH|nr:hypothetical protein GTHECHR2140 [Guillardia theta]CAC26997.1 hypothetical protein [Guillardia theta]